MSGRVAEVYVRPEAGAVVDEVDESEGVVGD
jgi:hypothetical protein